MVEIREELEQQGLLEGPISVGIFRDAVECVRAELDEHRGSINENTDEIQANFVYLCELDKKIEQIAARLDALCLTVQEGKVQKEFKVAPLTSREKEVFLALYSLGEVQPFVSYKQLSRKLCTSDSLVAAYISSLVEKGVPVMKKYDAGIAYFKLDDEFRQLQAKKNLVGVNTVLSYWL